MDVISLSESVSTPAYLKIALDIASRIASGEFKENSRIYGRSVMSSEYSVSPETIRRALKLLSDMQVVDIKQSSGTVVLSKKNAQEYIRHFKGQASTRSLHLQLKNLIAEQSKLNKKIINISNLISRTSVRWSHSNPFKNFEIEVKGDSPVVGKSINDLNFWHVTGATIIAIRRDDNVILSPGPYAVFSENDTIIFIGDQAAVDAVTVLVNPK
ncbi:MAG: TrkA C-terminal domain-containing protein [Acetivibrionales bacterium]|jgi:K+/H+ antiporter YhaU regulatory subunit KhtT